MPVPAFNICLVCEEVRPELGGKSSILGFFGATPNVTLNVPDLSKPTRLTFALLLGPSIAPGEYAFSSRIENGEGQTVAAGAGGALSITPDLRQVLLVLGWNGLVFSQAGTYVLVLFDDAGVGFRAEFRIETGGTVPVTEQILTPNPAT